MTSYDFDTGRKRGYRERQHWLHTVYKKSPWNVNFLYLGNYNQEYIDGYNVGVMLCNLEIPIN